MILRRVVLTPDGPLLSLAGLLGIRRVAASGVRRPRSGWLHPWHPRNLVALAKASRRATISADHVVLDRSRVEPNVVMGHHIFALYSSIGRHTIVGPYTSLTFANVGAFSGIAEACTVGAYPHWPNLPSSHFFPIDRMFGLYDGDRTDRVTTTIGCDVWVGARVVIKSGVRIGHGAVIGAGAVVTRDVDDYEIVAGVPAKHIRMRFAPELIVRLLRLRWWDWPPDLLRQNVQLFRTPLTPDSLEELEQVGFETASGRSSNRTAARP